MTEAMNAASVATLISLVRFDSKVFEVNICVISGKLFRCSTIQVSAIQRRI
jgi:hypothetical protein